MWVPRQSGQTVSSALVPRKKFIFVEVRVIVFLSLADATEHTSYLIFYILFLVLG